MPTFRLPRAAWLAGAVIALVPAASASAAPTPPWDPFFASPQTAADFGAAARPFGTAVADFDEDGHKDLVAGRVFGNVHFAKGNGNGTFAPPTQFAWKQTTFNAWSFASGDLNGDGNVDLVWGANAATSGCSVSPVPSTGCPSTVSVNDGDVRVFYGNGNGTFAETTYFVTGVRHNAGTLLADIGTDAGSVDVADVDGDGDQDVIAGAGDAIAQTVALLRNNGDGTFTRQDVVSGSSVVYFPATSAQNSPWGLAFGDADGDGDKDLFVGDRALYVYLYVNDGTGAFTVKPGNIPGLEATRPNVYLRHDSLRADVGFTPSLSAGDLDGDGRDDLLVGLHSGGQTPAANRPNDGTLALHLSKGGRHEFFGTVADVGTNARGVRVADVNGDGNRDLLAAEYDGKVALLRQLEPKDTDSDGVSDYVDNAPEHANAPRIEMDSDGSLTYKDQLDNDHDTVLGDPEDPSTWQRRGDPADPDDDNDGVPDGDDNCRYAANAGQADADDDDRGDACDALDDRDGDDDGVPTGPSEGDPLFEEHKAAAIKWSRGDTHFVLRIDALGRLFQNEFTGLMHDAGVLSPEEFLAKCQGMYTPGTDPAIPSCEELAGGKNVPISTVVIPRLLWTDPEVVAWMNDRITDPDTEFGQHGTFHDDTTLQGDWKDLSDRNFFSCETCGLTAAENIQRLRTGQDTLLGNYDNPWLSGMGATSASPKIDWASAAQPLITYAAPYNTSDPAARDALGRLGFKAFTASVHEETPSPGYGEFFSPGGGAMEQFGPSGMFHVSADTQLDPPEPADGSYDADDRAAFLAELEEQTDHGGLTTWLIEEVEWSGRACNDRERLVDCDGQPNRENNTVYEPRWKAWIDLLDYVKDYEGGVVMTLGEVALAKAYDNAPTVDNADQADADHDGVGDVIEGVTVDAAAANLVRNQAGTLRATVVNGAGDPLADQKVTFRFDADGDGTDEERTGTTDGDGVATVPVTPTRDVGEASFTAAWSGGRGVTADDTGTAAVRDETDVVLAGDNPTTGQVTDAVTIGARLVDSDGAPLEGRTLTFAIGTATATATTNADGRASAAVTLEGPAGTQTLTVTFDGAGPYGGSSESTSFTVTREDTSLTLAAPVTSRGATSVQATLREADGAPVAGRTIQILAEVRKGRTVTWQPAATAVTGADGVATADVPSNLRKNPLRAVFEGDGSFLPASSG